MPSEQVATPDPARVSPGIQSYVAVSPVSTPVMLVRKPFIKFGGSPQAIPEKQRRKIFCKNKFFPQKIDLRFVRKT